MLYSLVKKDDLFHYNPYKGVKVKEVDDPVIMAKIEKISVDETTQRFAEDNKAFVAFYNEHPAAYGWMAMGKAHFDGIDKEFILPLWHRFLWNFAVLPEYHIPNLYSHLLQFIIDLGDHPARCFWIHSENYSIQKQISMAGFSISAELKMRNNIGVIFNIYRPSNELRDLIESNQIPGVVNDHDQFSRDFEPEIMDLLNAQNIV